jgi:pimeloyl-ACP methyl ester carboxylesterase
VRALFDEPGLADDSRETRPASSAVATAAYAESSPDGPDHFDTVSDKIVTMWRNPLEMPIEELAKIEAPVLVMQGDDDGVRIDWSLALARALPHGQFAVVPGTGHGAPIQKHEVVNRMILDFLGRPGEERMLAMGALHDLPAM